MIRKNPGEAIAVELRKTLCWMILALGSASALAQDAKTVVANASRAMGLDGLTSLYYYGSGANYSLGQNNNSNIPWPKTPLNEYVRAIDFSLPPRAPPGAPMPRR